MNKEKKLSIIQIKRLLKEEIKGDVSNECVEVIREFLEELISGIAKVSLDELIEENELRKFHSQYQLKRIPEYIYKSVVEKILIEMLECKPVEQDSTIEKLFYENAIEVT